MTATERLRAMLDERGVKWEDFDGEPTWMGSDGRTYCARYEFTFDGLDNTMTVYHLTSAQAIAATLGAGTCHDVCNSVAEFTCSACGFNCDLTSWISLFDGDDGRHRHHHHGTPNYCPNCGRKVVSNG